MVPIAGGPAQVLALAESPDGLGVHQGDVYWSDTATGEVLRLPLGTAETPAVLASSSAPGELVVDDSGVYWIDDHERVLHVPLGGGPVDVLAAAPTVVGLATNSSSVYWISGGTEANAFQDGAVVRLAK